MIGTPTVAGLTILAGSAVQAGDMFGEDVFVTFLALIAGICGPRKQIKGACKQKQDSRHHRFLLYHFFILA
jgi:hypothetical protein